MTVLRPYQSATLADALTVYEAAKVAPYGVARRQLYSGACGLGKGSIELALASALRDRGARVLILTTRVEILRGFAERTDPAMADASLGRLLRWCEERGIWTYGRLYSKVSRDRRVPADVIIVDEAHHWMSQGGGKMSALLDAVYPAAIVFGFTATPFRGNPRSTEAFLEYWGGDDKIAEILSIEAAAREGWITIPDFRVVPLCDDEEVLISNGEFDVRSASSLVTSRAEAIASMVRDYREIDRRPSMLVGPSSECLAQLAFYLERVGVPSVAVLQGTKPRARLAAFEACRAGTHVLLSISVVGEGVDLPWLRVGFDAAPTMSPVVFLQRLGRFIRPGDQGRYIATNRNLERHGHLLGGAAPATLPRLTTEAFGSVGERSATARLGFERLGRLKRFDLPSTRGTASGYSLCRTLPDGRTEQFTIALMPWRTEPVVTTRINREKWRRCSMKDIPADVPLRSSKGRKAGDMTPPQIALWEKNAAYLGLDPGAAKRGDVDARGLDILASLLLFGGRS